MRTASNAFHTAVMNPNPDVRALMKFNSTLITNEDIHIDGVKFTENANLDENLKIGACPASTIGYTILNYAHLLDGFEYGEFEASLGVCVNTEQGEAFAANCKAVFDYGGANETVFLGGSSPRLSINGSAAAVQPPFDVHALLIVGATLYAISVDGYTWVAAWDASTQTLTPIGDTSSDWSSLESKKWSELEGFTWAQLFTPSSSTNAFMTAKISRWAQAGRGMWMNDNLLYEFYSNGKITTYEYAKLGIFIADLPTKRKADLVEVEANDRMTKFDVIVDDYINGIKYPITLAQIYSGLCNFVGVTSATTTFINSTLSFDEAPVQMENVTGRELLGWIAEASCTFARFTRDGELELAWFDPTTVTISASNIFENDCAEFLIDLIDKLQVIVTEKDIGVVIGTGENGYQIVDNPFLYGNSDTEVRTKAVPIYNRLATTRAYKPMAVSAICDWSIEAGDIVMVNDGKSALALLIFCQTITWSGGNAVVDYESTGSRERPIMTASNRQIIQRNAKFHEIENTIDGIKSTITDVEGNVSEMSQTVDGITAAVNASKLEFNANGLTIKNGGFKIINADDSEVFSVSTSGDLNLVGNIENQISFTAEDSEGEYTVNASALFGVLPGGGSEIPRIGAAWYNGTGENKQEVGSISTYGQGLVVNAGSVDLVDSSTLQPTSQIQAGYNGQCPNVTLINRGITYPIPIIISGYAEINSNANTNISFGSTPFTSQPVVITSWSSAGSYGSGNFGAIKVTSVSTSGFNAVIGGSTPSSGVISWIAIGT